MNKLKIVLIALFALLVSAGIAQPVVGMTTFFTNTTTPLLANTACIPTKTVTLSGWLFSVSSTSNCGFNWTNSTGGDGRFQYLVGFGTLTQATFGSDDGSEFALNNLTWGVSTSSWTSKSMTFVGYKNGLPVPGATLNATTPSGTGILNTLVVNFAGNTAFNDVDEIALAPNSATCNSILFFEDITIGTPTPVCVSSTLSLSGSSNVLCNGGSTGSATMSASGGAPFTYTWFPSGGNAVSATGLSAGIYTCVSTNSCGSTSSRTVQITEPSALVTNTSVTNVLCNGGAGSATLTASGGTGAYTYSWSTGATTSVTALLAGTYTVKATDANNCSSTKSVTITQPSALVTSTAVTNALCNGGTGSASLTASGGTGAYTYSWSTGATTSVTALLAGTYTVKATDANNCSSTKSVTITQPSALVTNTAATNALCNGGTGSASLTASGGTGAYTYSWSTGATTSVTALLAGTYTVKATDANNCSNTQSVTITQPSAISASTAQTNVDCNTAGSATVNPTGGTPSYSYTWSPSGGNASVASGLSAGNYTCTINDGNGCVHQKTFTIATNTVAPGVAISGTNAICVGDPLALTVSGATSYTWNTGSNSTSITPTPTTNTTYSVVGANGTCTNSAQLTVTVIALPNVTGSSTPTLICVGQSATLNANGAVTYSWVPAIPMSSVVSPTTTSNYVVTGYDANGCNTTVSVTVNVSTCTGIEDNSASIVDLNIYPNPSSGIFTINIASKTSVELFDVNGKKIIATEKEAGQWQLNINNQPAGIYFLKASQNGSTRTIKLIKE